jgi:hypothetical protein
MRRTNGMYPRHHRLEFLNIRLVVDLRIMSRRSNVLSATYLNSMQKRSISTLLHPTRSIVIPLSQNTLTTNVPNNTNIAFRNRDPSRMATTKIGVSKQAN